MSMERIQSQDMHKMATSASLHDLLIAPVAPAAVRLAADFTEVPFVFDQVEAESIAIQGNITLDEATERACLLHLVRLMEDGTFDGEA